LQEEVRLLPADAEIHRYLDEVDTLRMDVDRLEARLKRLEA
jgi:ubiquinone biosynthesis protein UbiJ